MPSIERAQAREDLGDYAAASTLTKARCLDALNESEQAKAHYRLLRDFYPARRGALVASRLGEEAEPLEREIEEAESIGSLPALKVEKPRYSASANRSHLGGSVLVRFRVGADRSIRDIRVLTMPHPLLASWVIEAVTKAEIEKDAAVRLPRTVVMRFVFKPRAPG